MTIGAILPHLRCFGGVRRFLELGNVFVERGIDYTIFARKPSKCTWFNYKGRIKDCSKIKADNIIFSFPPDFHLMSRAQGKIFIFVNVGGKYTDGYKKVYGKYPFIANNRIFKKIYPKAHIIEGGVNVHRFKPIGAPLESMPDSSNVKVLYYDAKGSHKGSDYIRGQLSGIKGVKLIGLKGLKDNDLAKAYQDGDFFVSWESRIGWSNTAAEALASGLTVVSSGFNCEPFADKIIKVKNLRKFFSNPENRKKRKRCWMNEFSWEIVVTRLMNIFQHYARKR